MIKRIILLSLIVLAAVLILPSCTRTVTPVTTPTPTVIAPKYTSAEAIAIITNYLYSRAKTAQAVNFVSRLNFSMGVYYSGTWRVGGFTLYENSGTVVPNSAGAEQILSAIENYNKQQ